MAKKMKPGQKRCPSCKALVSGTRTKTCPKCGHEFNGKPQDGHAAAPASVKPAKPANAIARDKPQVTKTQAVRDYLNVHPQAMNVEISAALKKQGITITPNHVSAIKMKIVKRIAMKSAKRLAAAKAAAPAVLEKPASGGTITLEQVKKVAHTIKMLGGYQRVFEVLGVIKELGGVKKFRDLAEAMTVTGTEDVPF